MKNYYMDNAATTPLSKEALEAMMPYLTDEFGNASTIYMPGQRAKSAIENSRRTIASTIGAKPSEIYFTSGGSESDNWALVGAFEHARPALREKGLPGHIITDKIEHHAILNTCRYLEAQGVEVTYLDVDAYGNVDPAAVMASIRKDTFLVSIMTANNEVGTVEPIKEIGEALRKHETETGQKILFHTDAVQAFGHIELDVSELNVDLMSSSAHKLNGPKGVGFLYIRRDITLPGFIHGGAQERGRRAGTENVPAIAGFARAAEIACGSLGIRKIRETEVRDHLIERLLTEIPGARLNGDRASRLPNNVNVCFPGTDGETLLLLLNERQIYASAGSACASGSLEPSHVLMAMGLSKDDARASLRLTISHDTSIEDTDYVADTLKELVTRIKKI
ncbi:cysteine desulfurase NifS [Oribacterium sp. C9]|uniref:cysteine desulfurase family protein n=1 Tax=Oribacterium sp. C9 TaxID=1943579 RepID=UPI00098EC076|nr:cysteine desulfurase family protein [Oribacterium sp. C9]OON85266.1 cysteine desulfurase NifS [Oribacterium sp. C9]